MNRIKWLSSLPFKYLFLALCHKFFSFLKINKRFKWTVYEVSHGVFPDSEARVYYDMTNIRTILVKNGISYNSLGNAGEIACGYGRVIPVLTEFSKATYGFERDEDLIDIANRHVRDVNFIQFEDIANFNSKAQESFDLLLISTVMQHLSDNKCESLADEIDRSIAKGKYLLLIENIENKDSDSIGDPVSDTSFISQVRSKDFYLKLFCDFKLVDLQDRVLEKCIDYDAGKLMLLQKQ